ncbi:MAG: Cartilage oligomeric matrix protein [Parcubacteria group bacterium GW2011_GWA1_45_7]|nr:MAG: Cartilage oligomeric matrix protein [Parcubacteria group bacterium GW2011_GWF1_45_5]KKU10186.1 MAG: Cartilage oligomeric matrix protein [Parcubacteria group bacterium GW2011_GWA1_45_7]KKU46997.1 MAG: Cartilage oligomeric matrix protein [Parcubacteria group bacterium GW2011_GWF2_46_8]
MLFTNILRGQLKKAVATFSVVTLLVSLCAPLAVAVTPTAIIYSIKDSYVKAENGDGNYGTEKIMKVRNKSGANQWRSLVAFDLSSIPSGSTVTSAQLEIYLDKAPNDLRTYQLYRITGTWVEGTVTWDNQPGMSALSTNSVSTGTTDDVWKEWDVTADIQAFVDGTYSNYGWFIKDGNENENPTKTGEFCTKDFSGSGDCGDGLHKPQLVLYYTTPVVDTDQDGVPDSSDNCPLNANPGQEDMDGDGQGDVCDSDRDGDGIPNSTDNCVDVVNPAQEDADSDGAGDVCDPDDDNDGILDTSDNCPVDANPNQEDVDSDGIGDVCDADIDGDGVLNDSDNCVYVSNSDQVDVDQDGIGDACDSNIDTDADGIPDTTDNCPLTPNQDQADMDQDNIGDVCDNDSDNDTILDDVDNCVYAPNLDQADTDSDGIGNVCDPTPDGPDTDQDGVADMSDNCPSIFNTDQADADRDGVGDVCDLVCADGLDNDQDALIDYPADPGCTSSEDSDETNLAPVYQCSDDIDNDQDGWTDFGDPGDPGCSSPTDDSELDEQTPTPTPTPEVSPTPEPTPTPSPTPDPGYPIGGTFMSTGQVAGASTGGQVLGAQTCDAELDEYIMAGRSNNPAKVRRLQEFLNQYEGENIPVTGVYGPLTQAAVSRFQVKYHSEILLPWVSYGHLSEYLPTGHVYKTTQRWINMILCSGTDIPMPQLP